MNNKIKEFNYKSNTDRYHYIMCHKYLNIKAKLVLLYCMVKVQTFYNYWYVEIDKYDAYPLLVKSIASLLYINQNLDKTNNLWLSKTSQWNFKKSK